MICSKCKKKFNKNYLYKHGKYYLCDYCLAVLSPSNNDSWPPLANSNLLQKKEIDVISDILNKKYTGFWKIEN
jgi:hypothetical protein